MSAALSFTVLDDGRVVAASSDSPTVLIGSVRYAWPDWFTTADRQGAQFVDAVMWPDGTVLVAAHAQNLPQGNIGLMRCGQVRPDGAGDVRWAVDLGPATSNAKVMLDDLGRLVVARFCFPDVTFHVIDVETGDVLSAILLPGVPNWARSVLDLTPDGQVIYVPPVPGSIGGVACQFPITRGHVTIAAGFNVAQCLIEIDGVVGTLVDGPCFDPRLSRNGLWFCCHDGRGHVSSGLVPDVAPPLVVPTVPMPPVEHVVPLPANALVIGISFNAASVRPCNATFPVRCAPESGLAVIDTSDPTIARLLTNDIATWITDNPGETCEQMIDRVRGDHAYVQRFWVVPDGRPEPLPASILSRLRPGDLLGVEIAPHAETIAESVALAPCLELQRQSDADNAQLLIDASIAYRAHGWQGLGIFAFGRSDVSMEPLRPYLARLCQNIAPVGVWPVVATPAPHPHPTPDPIPAPHPMPAPVPVPPVEEDVPNPTDQISYAAAFAAMAARRAAHVADYGQGALDAYRVFAEGTSLADAAADQSHPAQTPQPNVTYGDWVTTSTALAELRHAHKTPAGYAEGFMDTFRRFGGEHWPLEYVIADAIGAAHPSLPFTKLF